MTVKIFLNHVVSENLIKHLRSSMIETSIHNHNFNLLIYS